MRLRGPTVLYPCVQTLNRLGAVTDDQLQPVDPHTHFYYAHHEHALSMVWLGDQQSKNNV